jgi:hypothetical protein
MPISLVSSVILCHRRGINHKSLIKETDWLIQEIIFNGGEVGVVHQIDSQIPIMIGLRQLQPYISKKKGIYKPKAKKDMLVLQFYSNMMLHHLFDEAIISEILVCYRVKKFLSNKVIFE